MKVAVYTIAKNEAKHVERWIRAAQGADHILICDTGSEDNTVKLARWWGATVVSFVHKPFRFSAARNHALDALPDDVDWCISVDMDELLQPGWREALEALQPETNAVCHKVVCTRNTDGTDGLTMTVIRAHRRKTHRWKYACHEALIPVNNETRETSGGLVIVHDPDTSKPRTQYLGLLEQAVRDDPECARSNFYLAREYLFHNENDMARLHFEATLELEHWAPQRAACWRYLAAITPASAEEYMWRAVSEDTMRRETWVGLAMLLHDKHDWERCRLAAEWALSIEERPTDYFCEQYAWGFLPHDLMALACWHTGRKADAIFHGQLACEMEPGDARLADNLRWYTHGHVA